MNGTDFAIVPMAAEHIDCLARLERLYFAEPWSAESLRQELDVDVAVFFTALAKNRVIGYAGMHNVCGQGYITNIVVDEAYRHRGAATALLCRMFDCAVKRDMEFISLEVRVSNQSAIRLYDKLGFENAGRRRGFYSNPREDAFIMTKYFNIKE